MGVGEGTLGARPAGRDVLAADPGDPEAHAARWLGWLAYRMDGRPELDWWVIPAWVPGGQLRLVRRVVAGAVLAACAGLAAVMDPLAATLPGIALLLAFVAGPSMPSMTVGPAGPASRSPSRRADVRAALAAAR